jgi:CxxC motif-containing protein
LDDKLNNTTERKLTCIACPLGCSICVMLSEGRILRVFGNKCKKGAEYAVEECTNPVRTLTGTVRLIGGDEPLLPVKSDRLVPKGKIFDCMREINSCSVSAPVKIGDIVIKGILGMDANIVAAGKAEAGVKMNLCRK